MSNVSKFGQDELLSFNGIYFQYGECVVLVSFFGLDRMQYDGKGYEMKG